MSPRKYARLSYVDYGVTQFKKSKNIKYIVGYYILKIGGVTSRKCIRDRYQPFRFTTEKNPACTLSKYVCNEVGQIIFDNGNNLSDRQCKCDNTLGYDFVKTPKNVCYCIPSEEDCSCYYKECFNMTFLTPGKYKILFT